MKNKRKIAILSTLFLGQSLTVKQISEQLDMDIRNASYLCLLYHKQGLLNRYKGEGNVYYYSLSRRGSARLMFLLERF